MKLLDISRSMILLLFFFVNATFLYSQTVTPWLTKGDRSALLEEQTSISFSSYTGGGTTLVVDTNTTFQTIDGFGFCLTQGSAEVINGMTAASKAQLL